MKALIGFECGCFGHSKDKCPSIIVSPAVNPSSGDPNCSSATSNSAGNVEMTNEMEARNETPSVIKDDMGTWMLMNYRNTKKASKHGGTVKSPIKGSRFSVLHDEIANATNEPGTIADSSKNPPASPIVKLWTSFKDKQKKMQAPSTSKATPSATGMSKPSTMNASSGKNSFPGNDNSTSRVPLVDLSNVHSGIVAKPAMKYQRKVKVSTLPSAKHQSSISEKLSLENADNVFSSRVSGIFGHCPPDDHMVESNTSLHPDQDSSCFVEKVFTDNSNLTVDENLSSSLEEEMVNA
uniref:uncharacterized protein LOC105352205 n=1 Tax=Fragaria vesca subsp. vesca TaxID=101020 RepID=UPI0005CB4B06|nr:PREDICTED: uncharacterized protein LOC105352205 [Fragaria vesca subsp. vesca]XP_011466879.1 PREDICTED: uncharacterized protein LOC105352205 [Fragaria vesca subsp. vesca]XP_011466880.1 PREDICTED: uncharacterized protein LOC105352205 [Fragaria vesca subsp. vesca]XP_011466881.1 PREDICTED: uncharacterized protein LOC105352205 [Fragaria vesca subsp. vesca]XP_011466882.1 PREDICTED: uncharacterized protein LOC105352205 [Fragaria vesca subsp. vesca]